MIRLGSLAGYAFEGPRALAGWTAPHEPAVYAILAKADPKRPQEFAVIYVGHADDLSAEGFPFRHPRSAAWIARGFRSPALASNFSRATVAMSRSWRSRCARVESRSPSMSSGIIRSMLPS